MGLEEAILLVVVALVGLEAEEMELLLMLVIQPQLLQIQAVVVVDLMEFLDLLRVLMAVQALLLYQSQQQTIQAQLQAHLQLQHLVVTQLLNLQPLVHIQHKEKQCHILQK